MSSVEESLFAFLKQYFSNLPAFIIASYTRELSGVFWKNLVIESTSICKWSNWEILVAKGSSIDIVNIETLKSRPYAQETALECHLVKLRDYVIQWDYAYLCIHIEDGLFTDYCDWYPHIDSIKAVSDNTIFLENRDNSWSILDIVDRQVVKKTEFHLDRPPYYSHRLIPLSLTHLVEITEMDQVYMRLWNSRSNSRSECEGFVKIPKCGEIQCVMKLSDQRFIICEIRKIQMWFCAKHNGHGKNFTKKFSFQTTFCGSPFQNGTDYPFWREASIFSTMKIARCCPMDSNRFIIQGMDGSMDVYAFNPNPPSPSMNHPSKIFTLHPTEPIYSAIWLESDHLIMQSKTAITMWK